MNEWREMIFKAQHGYCARCLEKATELHHRVPNTKTNRKLFGLYIDSPFNLVGLCRKCHEQYKEEFRVQEDLAIVYESYLQEMRNASIKAK